MGGGGGGGGGGGNHKEKWDIKRAKKNHLSVMQLNSTA